VIAALGRPDAGAGATSSTPCAATRR